MQIFFPRDYFENIEGELKSGQIDTTFTYLQKYQNYCQKFLTNQKVPLPIKKLFFNPQKTFFETESKILDLQKEREKIILKTELSFLKEEQEQKNKNTFIFHGVQKYLTRKIYPNEKTINLSEVPPLHNMIPCHFVWTFDELALNLYLMHFHKSTVNYYSILFDFERVTVNNH